MLSEHTATACQVILKDPLMNTCMTAIQKKLLLRRTKGLWSDEDKWIDMYKILFPDSTDKEIPSPCESQLEIIYQTKLTEGHSLQ
jgi:hypothetical protein